MSSDRGPSFLQRRTYLFLARIIYFGLLIVLLPVLCFGQDSMTRWELGTQYSILRVDAYSFQHCFSCAVARKGVGPTATLNINRTWALDAAAFVTPSARDSASGAGQVAAVQAGIKAQVTGNRFGFFAKARPGFVSYTRAFSGVQSRLVNGANYITVFYAPRNFFALDLGGGIEVFLGRRMALRADLGDTLIRSDRYVYDRGFHNNLQFSSGVYFRTGNALPKNAREGQSSAHAEHRFWDKTNIFLTLFSMAGQSVDAITTQHLLARKAKESNPLAEPFVSHGWAGQISAAGLLNAAELLTRYGLHRTGHHRVERAVPLTLGFGSALEGGLNAADYR